MEQQFRPGDVVQLRSGGLPMTVDWPDDDDVKRAPGQAVGRVRYMCVWQLPSGDVRREWFVSDILVHYRPPQQPYGRTADGMPMGPTWDEF